MEIDIKVQWLSDDCTQLIKLIRLSNDLVASDVCTSHSEFV